MAEREAAGETWWGTLRSLLFAVALGLAALGGVCTVVEQVEEWEAARACEERGGEWGRNVVGLEGCWDGP